MKDGRLKRFLLKYYYKLQAIPSRLDTLYTNQYIKHCRIKKNKVVFNSYYGKKFDDNPKYVAEELLRRRKFRNLVWLANSENIELPTGIRAVKRDSNRAMRELSSAKFYIDNIRSSIRPPKKVGQIYIQTWHGNLGFKYVEKAVEDRLSKWYVNAAKQDGKNCDVIISACKMATNEYIRDFWLNDHTEILEVGSPRNDPLFDTELVKEKYREIREFYNIDFDKKIVLCLPTFREKKSLNGYRLDFKGVVAAMKERFGDDFVIIVKFHPNVENLTDILEYDDVIINGLLYPDTQELYMAADFLITDYSSVAFDYMLLRRPIFLCTLDIDDYNEERGLKETFDICPFIHCYTNEELLREIRGFDREKYFSNFDEFVRAIGSFENGQASEKVVDWMESKL